MDNVRFIMEKCVAVVVCCQGVRVVEGDEDVLQMGEDRFRLQRPDCLSLAKLILGPWRGEGGSLVSKSWKGVTVPCWLVVVLVGLLCPMAWAAGWPTSPAAAKVYRITGVAVSGRDGSFLARARITVSEVERGVRVQTGDEEGGLQGGGPGGGGFVRGGLGGRPGRGGLRRGSGEANGSQDPEAVMTDARGRFSVVVPHQGTYRVAGSARGYRQQAYEARGSFFAGVVLTPAAPEMNVTLKLTGDATLSGLVFDEAGEGVRNAQVRVEEVRPEGANRRTATRLGQFAMTDDRGHYEISPLAPGKYRVRVTARPWYASGATGGRVFLRANGGAQATASVPSPDPSLDLVYPETWFPAATDATSAETVTLSGGEERQADFHLTPIPSIHLRVPRPVEPTSEGTDGRRGPGAPMVLRSEAGAGFGFGGIMTTTTTADGSWDIGGLSPGTYTLRQAGLGGGGLQVTLGGAQTTVSLAAATTSVPVTVSVEGVPERSVRQITLIDPVTRQSFQANGERRGGRIAERDDEADGEGEARTVQVPPGRYEVYLAGTQGLFLTGLTAEGAAIQGRTVTVGGPMKLTIHAATGLGQVEGVAQRDGKAVVAGLVLLVPAGYGREDNLAPVREDETNTDGSFTVRGVIPGGYIVVAIENGWGVNWRDSGTLVGYLGKGVAVEVKGDETVRKDVEGLAP